LWYINATNPENILAVTRYNKPCFEVKKYTDKLLVACGDAGMELIKYLKD